MNEPTLDPNLVEKYKGRYTFFYGGLLSNWAPAEFNAPTFSHVLEHKAPGEIPQGWNFNCSEQYMMLQKAICFQDWGTAWKILHSKNPAEQKSLGRQVKNFDPDQWNAIARAVVYEGCYHKFTHNKGARDYLLSIRDSLLVEASPYDKVWGIGLGEKDPRVFNPANWQGANWLGEVLTVLRDGFLTGNAHRNPYTKVEGKFP